MKNSFDNSNQNRPRFQNGETLPLRTSSSFATASLRSRALASPRSRRRGLHVVALLLVAILAASGCTTKIKSEWKDETFPLGKIRNVLVIAATRSDTVRRFGESELVKHLRSRGVNAVESFTVLPDAGIDDARFREAVVAKIKEGSIDAVLIARSLGSRTETESSQATIIYTAPYASYDAWYSYYAFAPDWSYPSMSPSSATGISVERDYLTMEASLYDAQSGKLVWQLRSETQVVGLPEEEIKPYAGLVARKLFRARLF